jgi:hypothetical protein
MDNKSFCMNPIKQQADSYVLLFMQVNDRTIATHCAIIHVKELIESYQLVYKYYLSNNCILILNKDLRNNPKEIINKIFEPLGRFNVFNEEKSKQLPKENYVKSSKEIAEYKEIVQEISSMDLSEIRLLYKKAKEKAVRV